MFSAYKHYMRHFIVVVILSNVMAEMSRDHPEQKKVSEGEIDRMAEAVMVLRRSGLFSVEPLESNEENPFSFNMNCMGNHNDSPSRQYEMTSESNREFKYQNPVLIPPTSFSPHGHQSSTPAPRDPGRLRIPHRQARVGTADVNLQRNSIPASRNATVLLGVDPSNELNKQHGSIPTACNPSTTVNDPLVYGRVPRISTFSGSISKGEISFEAWEFEVKCLMRDKVCHRDLQRPSFFEGRSKSTSNASRGGCYFREYPAETREGVWNGRKWHHSAATLLQFETGDGRVNWSI
jgi:hypothetical protein